jgi:putative membrane protein
MMFGYSWSWGGMLLMMLSWLFWFALLGLLLWALFRWIAVRGPGQTRNTSDPAADILRQRYARGEIDEATFDLMRQQLESSTARDAITVSPDR